MKTGIIASGGGARGIIQAGMFEFIEHAGIDYDVLIGTSVGSLNSALYHGSVTTNMLDIWKSIRNKDVYNFAPWNLFSNNPSFFDVSPLRRLITSHVDIKRLQINPRLLFMNTTNVKTWATETTEIHTLTSEEDLVNLMLSSTAAPIAFPTVDGCYYDGGLTANYSIPQAVKLGCDRIIVLGVSVPEFSQVSSMVQAFECVASIPEYAQLTAAINETNKLNSVSGYRNIEVIVIRPDKPTGINLLDFDLKGRDRQELIDYGYNLAYEKLSKIS